jgi:IclR family transcriptional regulator, mhp operon transcriptional activator
VREIVWPIAIATLSGTTMLVRETTDHSSPVAVERYSAGFRVPLLTSATGRAYLAHCPATQRDTLIEVLARSGKEEDRSPARAPNSTHAARRSSTQGYAVRQRSRPGPTTSAISVPVRSMIAHSRA